MTATIVRSRAPDLRVGKGHLAVVRAPARFLQELLRWIVGRMRIVEVNPGKERLRRAAAQPLERGTGDHVSFALGLELRGARRVPRHTVVIRIETAGKA